VRPTSVGLGAIGPSELQPKKRRILDQERNVSQWRLEAMVPSRRWRSSISRSSSFHAPPLLFELAAVSPSGGRVQLEFPLLFPHPARPGCAASPSTVVLGGGPCRWRAGHRAPPPRARPQLAWNRRGGNLTAPCAQARAPQLAQLQATQLRHAGSPRPGKGTRIPDVLCR